MRIQYTTIIIVLYILFTFAGNKDNPLKPAYMVLCKSIPKDHPKIDSILSATIDMDCASCDVPAGYSEYFLSDTIEGLKEGYYVLCAGIYNYKFMAAMYRDCMKEKYADAFIKKVFMPAKEIHTISEGHNVINCENYQTKKMATLLYPLCVATTNKEVGKNSLWKLKTSSYEKFNHGGNSYMAYTWSETYAPCASTNFTEWHRGGIVVTEGDEIIAKIYIPDLEIEKVLPAKESVNIVTQQVAEYHGNTNISLFVYNFDGFSLKQTHYKDIGDSNGNCANTETEPTIFFRDLNSDGYNDILVAQEVTRYIDCDKKEFVENKELRVILN